MSPKFLLETVLLLIAAQAVLGAVGYATRAWPWFGLILLPLLVWLVVRVGSVLRDEVKRAQKKGADLEPARLAIFIAALWQLPALLLPPLWAPSWVTEVWQGAVRPLPAVFSVDPGPWLWAAALAEGALLLWIVLRPEPKLQVSITPGEAYTRASGQWAVARRRDDVLTQRGKKTEE